MLVRYLPVIFLLTALVLALAPLEAAGQSSVPGGSDIDAAHAGAKADKPRPKTGAAPVNANAAKTPLPPGTDARKVRPAEAFPPERISPSARRDDPRSVEERPDPGG
jgi:hypothetical protein